MKIKNLVSVSLLLATVTVSEAKVSLTSLWGDNMVIQRNKEVLFSGRSDGKAVEITPSWGEKSYRAKVNKSGEWSVKISTPDAGEGYSVTFDDGDKLTLNNVLLGDVWLCMGQSNMEMPMAGFGGQPVFGGVDVISQARESRPIRMYKAKVTPSATAQSDNQGEWGCNSSEMVSAFSATGYFFGSAIQSKLDIPIGLICVDKGGSSIETWMSREWLVKSNVKEYDFSALDRGEPVKQVMRDPCYLYNGMISPLKNLAVTGMLWYQGESNVSNADEYLKLFPTFVNELRQHLGDDNLPFYYVQTAPFGSPDVASPTVLMREKMAQLMDITPRTGMVTLTDLGESAFIHPRHKREVGERLALWALKETYGINGFECRAPEYGGMEVVTNEKSGRKEVHVNFNYADNGVSFKDGIPSTNFELAGEDQIFYPATALADFRKRKTIVVWSDDVPEPVAVRYAYKNFVVGDLYNNFGIPVSSFRSDDWSLNKR